MGLISFKDPKAGSKYTVPPFWAGKSASLKWFIDGSPTVLSVASWRVKQVVTEGRDHVCGEKRGRPWRVVDGYDIEVQVRQRDLEAVENLLAAAKVDDDDEGNTLGSIPAQHAVCLVLRPRDGSRQGFMTSGIVTVGAWEFGVGGQTDRNTMTIPFHAQDINFVTA